MLGTLLKYYRISKAFLCTVIKMGRLYKEEVVGGGTVAFQFSPDRDM